MPHSLLTPQERTSADDAKTALERLFGVSMQLCAYETICERCVSESTDCCTQRTVATATLPVTSLPAEVDPDRPFLQRTARDRFLVGIPIDGKAQDALFAVGEVEARPDELLAKLADLALENEQLQNQVREQESQLECYADQVIQDLDERSWFEELTGLEVCDVTNGVEKIAARLLPHLRQIIHAEAITFVGADRGGSLPSGSPSAVFAARCWVGDQIVDTQVCYRLVDRYRHDAVTRPVVRNSPSSPREEAEFPGVESFILVAVSRKGSCIGWLLAINRSIDRLPPSSTLGFGQESFGTAEARLLHSAAVALATHNHSLELFQANKDLAVGAIQSLAGAVDAKDSYTRGHSDRVGQMAQQLGHRLQLDQREQEQLLMMGLLHDIGKIGIPDAVLRKPGKLTEAEFDLLKRHPAIGYRILEPIEPLKYALPGVLHHHEAFDGSGYPGGLTGPKISRCGRILAIVDAYDAMTSNRPYRDGMAFETAEEILEAGAGTQWDPAMVAVFLEHAEDFRDICRKSRHHCQSFDQYDQPAAGNSLATQDDKDSVPV